ncbi:MAG: hypothetical protein A2201_10590 [Alicyclobacillus sp. RIFOXYA1_FULL_53_8]|nr:MAG: hypothetical protein A2201_10590 [Alicyclobacillus sp. RIFOXYA1_FULL_53_8]
MDRGTRKSNSEKRAKIGLVLGIIGMIAWFIPIIGLPVNIVGIVFASLGMNSNPRRKAITGLTLSIIGVVLSLLNAVVGAVLGSQGKLF